MRQLAAALIDHFRHEAVAATPGKREQTATRAMFFAAGFATAAWAALVPFTKGNTGIGDGTLGLLLLCLGGGALVAMPATGPSLSCSSAPCFLPWLRHRKW